MGLILYLFLFLGECFRGSVRRVFFLWISVVVVGGFGKA